MAPRTKRLGRVVIGAVLVVGVAQTAWADEPRGCDKFKWPVAEEKAALTAPHIPILASSATGRVSPGAFTLSLVSPAAAKLPMPPERATKRAAAFAGYAAFAAPKVKGLYQVVLSAGVWVDLVQNGNYLKPKGFSGALDCTGVRKLVRFEVEPSPFVLQVSGAPADQLGMIVEQVPAP